MPQKHQGTQSKDDKQFENQHRQGMDKEKSAQAGEETAGRRAASDHYEEWTKDELYNKAREIGIGGRSSMSKAELIRALRHH